VPHQPQNLGGPCLAPSPGFRSIAGGALGGAGIGGLGTNAAGVIGFSGTVAGISTEIGTAGFSGMGRGAGDTACGTSVRIS